MGYKMYKYQGAGNDFIIADNRDGRIRLTPEDISAICDRRYGIGADGLMLLESAGEDYDFKMVYYNSDGSGGMMCGNGGRCIVAFADFCGIKSHRFIAADGPHEAEILSKNGLTSIVRLKMKDVDGITFYDTADIKGCFMDTGTRHLVCPVGQLDCYEVYDAGRSLRYHPEFAPIGANVNFIEPEGDILKVRTYEKGVEAETYACGTGITASAIAYWHYRHRSGSELRTTSLMHDVYDKAPVHQPIKAVLDSLAVDFTPTPTGATDVYLIGPATYVAEVLLP